MISPMSGKPKRRTSKALGPIEERIAETLRNPSLVSSDDLASLMEAISDELGPLMAAASKAEHAALDPSLLTCDAESERRRKIAAQSAFRVVRLRALHVELSTWFKRRCAVETEERRRETYDRAVDLVARSAADIRSRWPQVQAEVLSLLRGIAEATEAASRANRYLPQGAEPIAMPEAVAFRHSAAATDPAARPPLIAEMVLPDINNRSRPAWPPDWVPARSYWRPLDDEIERRLETLLPPTI